MQIVGPHLQEAKYEMVANAIGKRASFGYTVLISIK